MRKWVFLAYDEKDRLICMRDTLKEVADFLDVEYNTIKKATSLNRKLRWENKWLEIIKMGEE